jgi:hypothetical protein
MVANMSINFYTDLYISKDLEIKKDSIIKKIKDKSVQPLIYVITLAQGEQNHLEFYSSLLLKQHFYENTPLFIVGLAIGYEGALSLVKHIVEDIYQKTADTDIRSYILNHQKEHEEGRE